MRPLLPLPLAALVALASPAVAAESVAPFPVTVAEKASALKDWTYTVGNLTVTMEQGEAALLSVDGKPMGIYLKGKGSFQFKAGDPVMLPTLKFNLKHNTRLKVQGEGRESLLTEPLSEAILWFVGRDLPALGPAEGGSLAAGYQALAKGFAERDEMAYVGAPSILERLPLNLLKAYRTLNGIQAPIVTAELVGAQERYVYTADAVYGRRESFFIQRPTHPKGQVRTIVLACNRLGWTPATPPDPDVRLGHVDLDLKATKVNDGELHVKQTYEILRPGLRALALNFTHHVLTWDSLSGEQLGTVAVRKLTSGGKDVPFEMTGDHILVDLGRPMKNGEKIELDFDIAGPLLQNETAGAFNYWRLTPGSGWFPEPPMSAQNYTLKAKVAVEKPFVPIMSAKTTARTSTETHNVVEGVMENPIYWFSVAAGKYKSIELKRNNRTIRAWAYVDVPSAAEQLLKTAHSVLDFYDGLLGGVPFEEVNLVEVPIMGFGQAPPGMIWLTREGFNPQGDEISRRVAGGAAVGGWANRMITHEIAHQYWGNRLKIYDFNENWLSEAFAEFTSGLAIRAMKAKGPAVHESIIKDWRDQALKAAPSGTLPTVAYLQPLFGDGMGDMDSRQVPQQLTYFKGAYLLTCLQREVGEEAFRKFLWTYQRRFSWKAPAITQDVVDVLKAVTGRDFTDFMNQYFWGTAVPELKPEKK